MVTAAKSTTDLLQHLATSARALADAVNAVVEMQQATVERDYSLAEAAELLGGFSDDWLRAQCREGRAEHQNYGGRYYMTLRQIEAFRQAHAKKGK